MSVCGTSLERLRTAVSDAQPSEPFPGRALGRPVLTSATAELNGGHLAARQLQGLGVTTVFCVPGESYLEILDGLFGESMPVRLITCRHEAGAANMAVAHAKLTGELGVCLVSRAPGATHAAIGVHIAAQDSLPLLLIIGQVPRQNLGRDSFQEVDYRQMFGGMAKWVAEPTLARQIPEVLARAAHIAQAGRPGPVVVSIPEDVQREGSEAGLVDAPPPPVLAPDPGGIACAAGLLRRSERPLVIAGGPHWTPETSIRLQRLAEGAAVPVVGGFRSQDVIDNRSAPYAGEMGLGAPASLATRVRSADLIIALGTRLDEQSAGKYHAIEPPAPAQQLIHVMPDVGEPGRTYRPALTLVSRPYDFLERMLEAGAIESTGPRREWAQLLREEYEQNRRLVTPGPVDVGAIVRTLSDRLPPDAIVTHGAGTYTGWLHRYFQFKQANTHLGPVAGTMGFGLPAAVAAKLARPDRTVVCCAGDGCFIMGSTELATAARHGALPLVIVLFNNDAYGTILAHQQREHPGRLIGNDLSNPDFVRFVESFGGQGERVSRTDQ
ncbi:MAG: thiamine pyrophosphate-binding protein, partial [Candidatus Dormibacteraeota bacterium]|nr:thiamine pyrophosphate-binding protein [Candidatus Dormibacteraeota bacterium]